MSIWLILIVGVLAYITLDAFFEISAKISGWLKAKRAAVRAPKPPTARAPAVTISGVITFLWRYKAAFLFLAIFIVGVSFMRGCTPPWGKSRDTLRAERDAAQAEIKVQQTINTRDADIAGISRDLALIQSQLRSQAQRGRDALQAATPAHEAPLDPGLVAVWRANLDGLCVPRADGSSADPC